MVVHRICNPEQSQFDPDCQLKRVVSANNYWLNTKLEILSIGSTPKPSKEVINNPENADIVQLEEHFVGIEEVISSILIVSSKCTL